MAFRVKRLAAIRARPSREADRLFGTGKGSVFIGTGKTFVAEDASEVMVFVNGERHVGSPGDVVLRDRDQIVVEINGYIPPHPSFTFRPEPL